MSKRKQIAMMIILVLLFQLIAPIITTTKVVAIEATNKLEEVQNNSETDVETKLETIKFGSYTNENLEQEKTSEKIVNENDIILDDTENISEAYLEWNELSEEEKKNTIEPRKEYIDISMLKTSAQYVKSEATIPEKYNLRDELSDIKTENQGSTGNCYAYAALNSIETNIATKTGAMYDFSEMHVEYMTSTLLGGNRTLNAGGNFQTVLEYSKDLQGPVLESEISNKSYTEEEYALLKNAKPIATITETIEFPTINKRYGYTDEELNEFRKTVKSHIMENGSVYASIYFSESSKYYNSTTKGYACLDTTVLTNHAVSIIGWDDSYSAENFPESNRPINDGAWIALNSHGSSFGDNGVFYISYEDNWAEYNMSGIVDTTDFVDTYGPKVELTNYTNKNNSISATIKVFDIGGSGVDTSSLKYQWTQSSEQPTLDSFTTTFTNGDTLSKTYADGEQWYLWILAYDLIGNYSISGAVKELIFTDENFYNALCYILSESIITSKANDDGTYSIFMTKDAVEGVTNINTNYYTGKYLNNIEGIEYFINLKTLILQSQNISSIDNIIFPNNLEYLNIDYNSNLKTINNVILPEGLKKLSIRSRYLTEMNITFPSGLEELNLADCQNINWESMVFPNNLKILWLENCNLGEKVQGFDFPVSLTKLYIGNNEITNIDFLNNLSNLEELCIGANKISDISVVENFQKLKLLQAGETYRATEYTNHFGTNTNQINDIEGISFADTIKRLDLGHNKISNISNVNWPNSLQYLYLNNNLITSIPNINFPDGLGVIKLDNNLIEDISMEVKPDCNSLNLSNNKISDISKIKVSNKCTYIHGRDIDISNNMIEEIPINNWEYSRIDVLILSNNKISNIDNVIWPEYLDSLAIDGNNISALNGVTWKADLRYLILNNNNISEIKNVTWPQSLQALELVENNISNLKWIESGTNLLGVALNNNNIYNIESLSVLGKLQELHLDNNHIEDISVLESLSSLSSLSIKNQEIIKIIDDETTQMELPQIIEQTMVSNSLIYTENEIALKNCEFEEGLLKYSINNLGNVYAMVYGGNASGTTILITNSANDKFFEEKYTIYNKEDLIKVRYINNYGGNLLNVEIELANDINLGGYYNEETENWEGEEWIPIGTKENPFNATFDGNGYKIFGIYINSDLDYQGLIGYNQGNINNLGIENGYIYSTGDYIGGISGFNDNWYDHDGDAIINIMNCYNKASIYGNAYVGGISGYNHSTNKNCEIIDCYNEGAVLGTSYVAGIIGSIVGGTHIDKCYNSGNIISEGYTAGIAGGGSNWLDTALRILNCFNKGTITGTSFGVGGIIGRFNGEKEEDIVKNCYNIGDIKWMRENYSGEIVGNKPIKEGSIVNCYYSNPSEIKAMCGEDDETNNVYGLTDEYMKSIQFVNVLNSGNEETIWKIGDSNYQYPMLNWQQYTEKLEIDLGTYEEQDKENGKYITKIAQETPIKDFVENISTNGTIEIYKGTQKITDTETNIGTGMTVRISFNNQKAEYTIVVKGDINGDGKVKLSDLSKIKLAIIGKTQLEGAYKEAADLNGDGNVKLSDLSKMKLYLVGTGSL